jgi:hypothetical protein
MNFLGLVTRLPLSSPAVGLAPFSLCTGLFRRTAGYTLSDHKRNEEILEELKVEPVDEKLRRCKSNWLENVTRINNNRMSNVMLNFRPHGLRLLGRPLKRLLKEAETCLLTF